MTTLPGWKYYLIFAVCGFSNALFFWVRLKTRLRPSCVVNLYPRSPRHSSPRLKGSLSKSSMLTLIAFRFLSLAQLSRLPTRTLAKRSCGMGKSCHGKVLTQWWTRRTTGLSLNTSEAFILFSTGDGHTFQEIYGRQCALRPLPGNNDPGVLIVFNKVPPPLHHLTSRQYPTCASWVG